MTSRLRAIFFSVVFALTGVGTSLLGATLPPVLHHWQLTDARGGLLLLAAWGGSTSGAAFARGSGEFSSGVGLACSALALLTLPFAAAPVLLPLYALYGIGLGITMTSISLMRAREVTAQAADLEMNRLNLVWAVGAFCSPALALHSLRLLSITRLYQLLGATLALAALLAVAFAFTRARNPHSPPGSTPDPASSPASNPAQATQPAPTRLPLVPLRFCLFAAACVGLESGIGSWLTTYAERVTSGVGTAVSANTAFWAGLLLSRLAHSLPSFPAAHTRLARVAHIALVCLATLGLVLFPSRLLLPLAGLACGVGLGPLYPYILAAALPRFRSTAVFIMAGVGSSLVPWLTGVVSSLTGSLRLGLLAPVAALLILIASSLQLRSDLA